MRVGLPPGERRTFFFWITSPIVTAWYLVAGVFMVGMATVAVFVGIGVGSGAASASETVDRG